MPDPKIIAYKLQQRRRVPDLTKKDEGFAPWECVIDNGGTWDPGQMEGVWGTDWLIAYVQPGSSGLAAITSQMTSEGYATAHPLAASALLAKCRQFEGYADFKDDLYVENGRIVFPPPEDLF